jgi:hypothetical protein
MSFPILEANNGNDFYNKFQDSIKSFINIHFGPKVYTKNVVLVKDTKKRKLIKKEIETFIKIYLLPKLYLFYSKIHYNFALNIKGYYEYYYDSLNRYNNLCRYYLNITNPVVRKINYNINNQIKLQKETKNSNISFYDKIIENNNEIIKILKIFEIILGNLITENKNRDRQYDKLNTKLTSMIKIIDKIKKGYLNIQNNTSIKDFIKRLNIIYDYLKLISINKDADYIDKKRKIDEFVRDYKDLFELYKQVSLIFELYDFNINNFELNSDLDCKIIIKEVESIIIHSRNLVIIYDTFKKNILDNIKKINSMNKYIETLKSIKNNGDIQKTLKSIIEYSQISFTKKIQKTYIEINKKQIKNIPEINYSKNIKNYESTEEINHSFFKLLFYGLGYIKKFMIEETKYFKSISSSSSPTNDLIIHDNSNNKLLLTVIKKFEEFLEEKNELNTQKIKNMNEVKKEFQDDLSTFDEKQFDSSIESIKTSITTKNEKIKSDTSELKSTDKELESTSKDLERIESDRSSGRSITSSNRNRETRLSEKKTELTKKKDDLNESIKNNKNLLENLIIEKNKLLFSKEKEEKNKELLNNKIKLQDELLKKQDEISNPFKDFQEKDFIIFYEYLKKNSKDIKKEISKKDNKSPILSFFKQNYLFSLFFDTTKINIISSPENKLQKLLSYQLFFPKSKPIIRTNKEDNPDFNEDFMKKIREFIDTDNKFKDYFDYLDDEDKKFKKILTMLLKENRNEIKFQYLINNINTKDNITILCNLIKSCIDNSQKTNNKIYPYTNFIIAYFSIYLILINIILQKIS